MIDNVNCIKIDSIELNQFMTFDNIKIDDLSKYKIIFIFSTNATGKSTITSEAIYYNLFGRSLRYKKIQGLINKNYDDKNTYAKIEYNIKLKNYNDVTLQLQRNIINDNASFKLEFLNDDNNQFIDFYDISKVSNLTLFIKKLLDIDEKKFSILYLKSPFSESLFESKTTLLASITKVEYFNQLREDFSEIVKDLKKTIELKTSYLNNQNNLLITTKQKIEQLNKNKEDISTHLNLLDNLKNELNNYKKQYQIEYDKKNKAIANKSIRDKELNQLNYLKGNINTELENKRKEYNKYKKLINSGRCLLCEQPIDSQLFDKQLLNLQNEGNLLKGKLQNIDKEYSDILNRINVINQFIEKVYINENTINDSINNLNNKIIQIENKIKLNEDKQNIDDVILNEITININNITKELSLLEKDYNILNKIYTNILNKKSNYINKFYNQKISEFTNIYKALLIQFTNNKYYNVVIDMNNEPTFNDNILYESLSTSERKIVDIAFVISYIVYLSTHLKFKTFILDETFDSLDLININYIYETIYNIAIQYNLQIFITSNLSTYVFKNINFNNKEDVKIINLKDLIGEN